ncbi:MAG: 50S ribosomal protein L11 methyltransferase, partial [Gammaproteobacteria bacterium]|nr:50S ribosomal protein L11 methyltransferase [Gammaproteobacteria bacterium]
MNFWQITLKVEAGIVDELTDFLFEHGSVSVTLTDATDTPIFEPPANSDVIWEISYLTALFDESTDSESILLLLSQHYPNYLPDCQLEQVAEQAWERTCLEHFQAMQFGERLWICPSWLTPPDPLAINISLDPGLAFGTGTHPTTALCLRWLDAHPPVNQTVIDYGCGSGILAIAAAMLGASAVWAIDNNEQALLATQENAGRNHISATQLQIVSTEHVFHQQVDLLVANILALPLIELAPRLASYVKPNGYIVLSGILENQTQTIIEHYEPFMRIDSI